MTTRVYGKDMRLIHELTPDEELRGPFPLTHPLGRWIGGAEVSNNYVFAATEEGTFYKFDRLWNWSVDDCPCGKDTMVTLTWKELVVDDGRW